MLACLQSLKNQTFRDFQCIIVDVSTDGTPRIIEDFIKTDARFSVAYGVNKGGPGGARNAGVKMAAGNYVCFVDADDYCHPQMLEILYKTAQGRDIATARIIQTKQALGADYAKISGYKTTVFDDPLKTYLLSHDKIHTAVYSRLYKKSLVEQTPFIEDIMSEDTVFTVVVMDKAKSMAMADAGLYYYYKNPASIMGASFSEHKMHSYLTAIRSVHSYIKDNSPPYLTLAQQRVCTPIFMMLHNRAVRKNKDADMAAKLLPELKQAAKTLHAQGIISYSGISLHHKIRLWNILR